MGLAIPTNAGFAKYSKCLTLQGDFNKPLPIFFILS
jgi:hypothetical protein